MSVELSIALLFSSKTIPSASSLKYVLYRWVTPFQLVNAHPRVLAFPVVKRCITNTVLAANVRHFQASFLFFQDPNDLGFGEFGLLHGCFGWLKLENLYF